MGSYGRPDRFARSFVKEFTEYMATDDDPNDPDVRRSWAVQEILKEINRYEDDIYVSMLKLDQALANAKAHLDLNLRLHQPDDTLSYYPEKIRSAVASREQCWEVLRILLTDEELKKVGEEASPPESLILKQNAASRPPS